jgi:hypothetical protein
LDPLPVAPVLAVPFLLARFRRPVALLRLPPRPFSRCLPAALAAIALARLPGMKTLFAPFQQTPSHPRPAGHSPTRLLLFEMACRTLGRPWEVRLPEAQALKGKITPLQGAAYLSRAQHTFGSQQTLSISRKRRSGLWTPVAGTLAAIVKVWIALSRFLSHSGDPWIAIIQAVLGAVLAIVGPGAWSIGARLFGGKRIDVPEL